MLSYVCLIFCQKRKKQLHPAISFSFSSKVKEISNLNHYVLAIEHELLLRLVTNQELLAMELIVLILITITVHQHHSLNTKSNIKVIT